jgi:hypothetical protein
MLALINAKRLLNIFAGKRSAAIESMQGFTEVVNSKAPLDFLDVINLGRSSPLLAKLKANDQVVDVFKWEIVKEFESFCKPGDALEDLAEVRN